jgi:long-chain acyl-CoA synthetase
VWGEEVRRKRGAIPFRQYEPRRRRLTELFEDAARWRDRDYLAQGKRRISYAQFFASVDALADRLACGGAGPGQRVLLLAANSPEWVVSFWATLQAGAIIAPGNGWWSEEEVAHAVGTVKPAIVIGDPKRLAKLPAGAAVGDVIDVESVRAIVDRAPSVLPDSTSSAASAGEEDEAAVVVFTSGTTGLPKGATLAHRSVIANLHDLLARSGRLPHQVAGGRAGRVNLLMGPLFHIGGIQAMALALVGGGTLVFLEGRFDSTQVLDLIETERVAVWGGVPTMARRILDDPTLAGRDLSSVRSMTLGGAPVPPELIERLRAAFPNADRGVSTIYGMTELGGTVASADGALMAKQPGTSGRPHKLVDLRIAEPDRDGVGEILVRTPAQMLGYWGEENDPAVIDDDGFIHTGDLGRLDDGLLTLVGRSKDIVICAGENVAAPRVEAVLLQHPDVEDAAVVGLPHADRGEEVAAAVVPRADADIDPDALKAFAGTRLAHFEIPTTWWIRRQPLPTNDVGKVDKRRLRTAWPDRNLQTKGC